MEKVLVNDKVVIDRCIKGHGLWFDKGELLQVLQTDNAEGDGKVIEILQSMFSHQLKK
jgi:Zn-finger nucleic acid-binding protein